MKVIGSLLFLMFGLWAARILTRLTLDREGIEIPFQQRTIHLHQASR
ncbi:hypothetical protein [Trichloromonas sp.]